MYRRFSRFLVVLGIGTLGVLGFSSLKETTEAQTNNSSTDKRPNVVMIISDDMGYADMGAFGSEISTPNLDALAKQGMMLTNFHTGPTCSPSRSMILTGVSNHQAGLGTMYNKITDNQRGSSAYLGVMNDKVVTLATLLKDAGYHTYMTGKWHLGEEPGQMPIDRGFEESFAILEGAADHYGRTTFGPTGTATYALGDQIVEPGDDFYTARTYTDMMIQFIEKNRTSGKPFFGYLAHTVPHEPLQAADLKYTEKYMDVYSKGWDQIRAERFERQKELGIIPEYLELPERWPIAKAWDSLSEEEQRYEAKKMAVYAGMIEYMDSQVGKFVDYLKEIGEYENTIIIYFSDNGASGKDFAALPSWKKWIEEIGYDNSYENLGNPDSYEGITHEWSQAMTTPHYADKGTVAEGGIRGHFAVVYPGTITPGGRSNAFASVKDLTPTVLDYAGLTHPGTNYKGQEIHPIKSKSMRPLWEGTTDYIYADDEPIGFELYGYTNKALFMGDWKILKLGDKPWGKGEDVPWKLFNLAIDPTETKDLSQLYPDKLEEMIKLYEEQEKEWGYVPAVAPEGEAVKESNEDAKDNDEPQHLEY
jgi:arylsulfatase